MSQGKNDHRISIWRMRKTAVFIVESFNVQIWQLVDAVSWTGAFLDQAD